MIWIIIGVLPGVFQFTIQIDLLIHFGQIDSKWFVYGKMGYSIRPPHLAMSVGLLLHLMMMEWTTHDCNWSSRLVVLSTHWYSLLSTQWYSLLTVIHYSLMFTCAQYSLIFTIQYSLIFTYAQYSLIFTTQHSDIHLWSVLTDIHLCSVLIDIHYSVLTDIHLCSVLTDIHYSALNDIHLYSVVSTHSLQLFESSNFECCRSKTMVSRIK